MQLEEIRESKPSKSWLKSNGQPLCDTQLKKTCKRWSPGTWEAYLRWYETGRNEELLAPLTYALASERRARSVYEEFGHDFDPTLRAYIESTLSLLPQKERRVLELYFYEGRTEREIARLLKISRQGANWLKNRAIARLRAYPQT